MIRHKSVFALYQYLIPQMPRSASNSRNPVEKNVFNGSFIPPFLSLFIESRSAMCSFITPNPSSGNTGKIVSFLRCPCRNQFIMLLLSTCDGHHKLKRRSAIKRNKFTYFVAKILLLFPYQPPYVHLLVYRCLSYNINRWWTSFISRISSVVKRTNDKVTKRWPSYYYSSPRYVM